MCRSWLICFRFLWDMCFSIGRCRSFSFESFFELRFNNFILFYLFFFNLTRATKIVHSLDLLCLNIFCICHFLFDHLKLIILSILFLSIVSDLIVLPATSIFFCCLLCLSVFIIFSLRLCSSALSPLFIKTFFKSLEMWSWFLSVYCMLFLMCIFYLFLKNSILLCVCVCVFSAILWWFLFDYHSFFLDWYLQDSKWGSLCAS